ncbi:unnamed protein product [Rotaria magnacalcarata]|uniref:RING-type domain-containing protein n=2 Tax=Rotaria magnacalcarata TaxID=392030 RepID=A0A816PU19_9BILA|nr:unnamed protein product [Rotaria magnacalcarata]CAF2052976.1 unnamed protein product [Rotaria magnacalcarata]
MTSNNSYEYTDRASIGESLLCELCHNRFIDPVVTQCGYTYCGACIEPKIRNGSHCPSRSCNQLLTTAHLIINHPTISITDKLKIRCRFCGEPNLNRRNFYKHIKESCPERRIDCLGKDIGCPWSGPKSEHSEHIQMCLFEKLRPMVDELYKVIKKQTLNIEDLQNQIVQQKVQVQEQITQLEQTMKPEKVQLEHALKQQKIQFEETMKLEKIQLQEALKQQKIQFEETIKLQKIQLENAQSEIQNQKNEIASIPMLEEDINKLRRAIHGFINISVNATWVQKGVTVAGGKGQGNTTNKLYSPRGLFVDDDQTVVIADMWNHRIIQWKKDGTTNGQIVAGGKGQGNGLNQLNSPTDVLIEKETDSLIICDSENRRVVRWSRRNGTTQGEILIDNIACWGLAMDDQKYLYVSETGKHEVRRYQLGEKNGTLVAGGNGQGNGTNQLSSPSHLFVDGQQNIYVSDWNNHRVMKWTKDTKEGIVIAGGQGNGEAPTQLWYPNGLFVDTLGTLYVADTWNNRVMRWTQGAKRGTLIVGGNRQGAGANQFNYPIGLSFDRHGSLYVGDYNNHRVQRFSLE